MQSPAHAGLCLFSRGSSACGLYCAVMIPSMVVAMLFRLDLYTTGHAGHQTQAA